MGITIQSLPEMKVAYMRHIGPYTDGSKIQSLWANLVNWAKEKDIWRDKVITLGISHDDPSVIPAEKCRYDACVEIRTDLVDQTVMVTTVPGGKHAIREFTGKTSEIGKAWQKMYKDFSSNDYSLSDGACFEYYRGNCFIDKDAGIFKCDLCIPVQSKE